MAVKKSVKPKPTSKPVRKTNPLSWLTSSKKRLIVAAVLFAALLGAGGIALANSLSPEIDDTMSTTTTPNQETAKSIHIESNVPGVHIKGEPYCDSQKFNKPTPYDCILPQAKKETVLTAPEQTAINGEAYNFKTWDGCSEANKNKKVCKIIFKKGGLKTVKVSYEKASAPKAGQNKSSSSTDNGAIGCKAASEYIIAGPRKFTASNTAELVLYNRTKDPFKPTSAQIWSGNSCKEVALKNELKATNPTSYSDPGFGISSSDVPVQQGFYSYSAVHNKADGQWPEVIIRDDGKVVSDRPTLTKKFNIASDVFFIYEGWTDQKTMLFYIKVAPPDYTSTDPQYGSRSDRNTANWFFYNVETDIVTHGLPY